jgi:hypothetical protein
MMLFNCLGYIASNGRMIVNDEFERCESKWSWPVPRYYPTIFLMGLRKTTKDLKSG